MRFFIAGGGCYGDFYVTQLLRAHDRGKISVDKILVVDRAETTLVSEKYKGNPKVDLLRYDWEKFGSYVATHAANLTNDHWVPTPIGPHIIYHWVVELMLSRGLNLKKVTPPLPTLEMPYFQWLKTTLVLSHAPGVCPTTCVEPQICPLTKGDRDWEMKETLKKFPWPVFSFVCQHFAHAVGTILFRDILKTTSEIEKSFLERKEPTGIATVSSCHGIVEFAQVLD